MTEIIDTNVFIDYLREKPKAKEFLENKRLPGISIISYAELIRGAKDKRDQTIIEKLLSEANIIPITTKIGDLMLSLIKRFSISHGLTIPDALIAATAIEEDLTLVTSNTKHFSFIPELKLTDWNKI